MKKFVVLSGGFHPFHAGHANLYRQAKKAFPDATVLVCATNVQTERPFPFELKKKLAQLSGVPSSDFIEVSRQFSAEDPALLQRIGNLDDSIVIFVRSDKDRDEQPQGLPLNPTRDKIPLVTRGPNKGKPQKLLDYNVNKNNLVPASEHTYMAYLDTVEFGPGITSASEIRKAWPTLNDKRKLTMVMSLYPATQQNAKLAQNVVNMFDQVMGSQGINENLSGDKVLDIAQRMIQKYKDHTYTAYERASGHAMNYEINDPRYSYWIQVADEIKKQTSNHKKRGMDENVEDALTFANKAHMGQTRAGGEPYIKHPMRVADSIRKYKKSHNLDALISAALLHDTVEDTDTTHEALHDLFGGLVASLVKELTSDKDKIAKMGKAEYLEQKMATMSSYALVIKLADRLDNVQDIATAKTTEWRAKYKAQTERILDYIEGNRVLSGTHKKLINLIREKLSEIDNPQERSIGSARGNVGESVMSEKLRKNPHNVVGVNKKTVDYLDEN